ncbi:hypothetical protein AKO1_012246 [Acrasis kona]|uniref:Vacuolar fusion protein MON1 n=1 Tax=Acrasis kona TaxID=1008807 RepID=A0AAW2Z8A6_9EUKA
MYAYPDENTSDVGSKNLYEIKGAILAASSASSEALGKEVGVVTLSPKLSSAVPAFASSDKVVRDTKSDEVQQQLICSFETFDTLTLTLVMPADFTECTHIMLAGEVKMLLDFVFASVDDVVVQEDAYRTLLDSIFEKFFQLCFNQEDRLSSFLASLSDKHHKRELLSVSQRTISDELLSLETMSSSPNDTQLDPLYIVGSCYFVSGSLVLSHLNSEYTKQIVRYMVLMGFDDQKKGDSEVVVMEEVYLEVQRNAFGLLENKSNKTRTPHTLIVVTRRMSSICLLIRTRVSTLKQQYDCDYILYHIRNSMDRISSDRINVDFINHLIPMENTQQSPRQRLLQDVLVHYMVIDGSDGVVITNRSNAKTVQKQNLENRFVRVVELIREMLLAKKCEERSSSVTEYGMCFQDAENFDGRTVKYWVVGRLMERSEFYICYEEGIPMNIIEAASRLGTNVYY